MTNGWGNSGNSERVYFFFGSKITADGDCSHEIKKTLAPWKNSYDQPRQHIQKQRHYFANKGPSRQGYGLSSGHVWMWELDYNESWVQKNWCFWTLWCWRRLLRVPWTARRSNQSILKEIIFIGIIFQFNIHYSMNIHWKDWCWRRNSNTLATWCEELTHLKRPWSWERLK